MNRRDVMYNDFIVVGPASATRPVKGSRDVLGGDEADPRARQDGLPHGDNSGTDQMEKAYWQEVGVKPQGNAYVSAGLGMGEVLTMAAEQGYTLTDPATMAPTARRPVAVAVEAIRRCSTPTAYRGRSGHAQSVNYKGAMLLIEWITSSEGAGLPVSSSMGSSCSSRRQASKRRSGTWSPACVARAA